MSSAAYVHTGLWTNHLYDHAQGATLTLTATNSSYLVAFLALFLGFVAGHCWAIISFMVFQIRSTLSPRDGQHHQQQAILRNYYAPATAIWQLLLVTWSWRRQRGVKAIVSTLPVALLAAASALAFGAAGILSARVTTKESFVLMRSHECGLWLEPSNVSTPGSNVHFADFKAKKTEDYNLASTMAIACGKDSAVASDCVSYAPKQNEWAIDMDAPCPFENQMCYKNTAVRFDSGLLDSTLHFGINAPNDDRLLFRAVAECAPLVRDGYISDWHDMNGTRPAPGSSLGNVLLAQLGELWLELFYGPNLSTGLNSTLIFSDRDKSLTMFGEQLFSLATSNSMLDDPAASFFNPIPGLSRTDADINLLFLQQVPGMAYTNPVTDPWFEATTPLQSQDGKTTIYSPQVPISTVGCTMQYQWCDPSTGSDLACTTLTGARPSVHQARNLFKRKKQHVTLTRLVSVLESAGDLTNIAAYIPASALLLINKHGYWQMDAPRDDQWMQELSHMFGTMLMNYQIRNYRYAGGYQSALDIKPVIEAPLANETWMCDAQIVRRNDYQSLSVLGLALICGIGGLIIVVNLTLHEVVGWFQERYGRQGYKRKEWEMLQAETMQMKLYKSCGVDLERGDVSVATVFERMEQRRNQWIVGAVAEDGRDIEGMSSTRTLVNKEGMIQVDIRRVDSEGTLVMSPVSRCKSV